VQCESILPYSFSGAIDSWASGVLFDVVNVDGNALRFGNRGQDANGAGWAAAIVYFGIVRLQELIVINHPLHRTGHSVAGANLRVMVIGWNQIIRSHQEVYSTNN
jgi:hypothetical protein